MASPIKTTERGFTYLMLLLWVALAGVVLAALGTSWHLMSRREREAEWLWRGEQFKRALTSYEQASTQLQTQQTNGMSSPTNSGFDLSNSSLAAAPTTASVTSRLNGRNSPFSADNAASAASADSPASGASSVDPSSGGPLELKDLLEDRRSGKLVRHLRQVYRDPITDSNLWGLDRGPDGRIRGIYSRSDAKPLREALGVERYRDLVFSSSGLAASSAASAPDAAASNPNAVTPVLRRRPVSLSP